MFFKLSVLSSKALKTTMSILSQKSPFTSLPFTTPWVNKDNTTDKGQHWSLRGIRVIFCRLSTVEYPICLYITVTPKCSRVCPNTKENGLYHNGSQAKREENEKLKEKYMQVKGHTFLHMCTHTHIHPSSFLPQSSLNIFKCHVVFLFFKPTKSQTKLFLICLAIPILLSLSMVSSTIQLTLCISWLSDWWPLVVTVYGTQLFWYNFSLSLLPLLPFPYACC